MFRLWDTRWHPPLFLSLLCYGSLSFFSQILYSLGLLVLYLNITTVSFSWISCFLALILYGLLATSRADSLSHHWGKGNYRRLYSSRLVSSRLFSSHHCYFFSLMLTALVLLCILSSTRCCLRSSAQRHTNRWLDPILRLSLAFLLLCASAWDRPHMLHSLLHQAKATLDHSLFTAIYKYINRCIFISYEFMFLLFFVRRI